LISPGSHIFGNRSFGVNLPVHQQIKQAEGLGFCGFDHLPKSLDMCRGWSNAFSHENGDRSLEGRRSGFLHKKRTGLSGFKSTRNFTMCFSPRSSPGEWRSVLEGRKSGFVRVNEIQGRGLRVSNQQGTSQISEALHVNLIKVHELKRQRLIKSLLSGAPFRPYRLEAQGSS
jgi:hypothetical protein